MCYHVQMFCCAVNGDSRLCFCVDPRGMQISANVMDQHDGSLRVEFVPVSVGKHSLL